MQKMKEIIMPPYTVCRMCSNSMNDYCLERCAPAKDCQDFRLKDIDWELVPTLFMSEYMKAPPKVKGIMLAAFLTVTMKYLKGGESGRLTYRLRSESLPTLIQIAGLLDDPEKEAASHPVVAAPDRDSGK
jgi:hypothetical protein